jgi:acyl-CoA thioester hydrolase
MSETPAAFEMDMAVAPHDIDVLGHVNNVTYLRWVQDVAVAHWTALAPAADLEKLVWVVVRHEIDYKQPARLGDRIIARTWVGNATRVRFERYTELLRGSDRAVLAKALTLWCPLDRSTGKPASVSAEVRARFSVAAPCGRQPQPSR